MFVQERQRKIIEYLQKKGSSKVEDLAKFLNVSCASIRRDLNILHKSGLIQRTHGGAIAKRLSIELPFDRKKEENIEGKEEIATKSVELIKDNQTIWLDGGTTTHIIAEKIFNMNLTVVTNSIKIASLLSDSPSITVFVPGGQIRHITRSIVGPFAKSLIEKMNFDMIFLGADGVDEKGVYCNNDLDNQIKEAILQREGKKILVADTTKFSKRGFLLTTTFDNIDIVIVDKSFPSSYKKIFKKYNIKIF